MQATVNTTRSMSTILLPYETIFYILQFLDPYEVIRLRLVSKQFNGITHDARLWRTFYTGSHLPRPPGPFLWQSKLFLERILIDSARVSRTWTSQPINVVSRAQGPRISAKPSPVSTSFDFLFGRLFIWCDEEQLLAQDFETGLGRLLWQGTEPISSLAACSLTFPDAERVFVALRYVDEPISQRTPMHVHSLPASTPPGSDCELYSKLLEFPLKDDVDLKLGPLIFEMDLPEYANFPLSASAPFLFFHGGIDRLFGHSYDPMVMDARTWATYKFPAFSSKLDAVLHKEPTPWWPGSTVLSGGHIIVFYPWRHWDPPVTLIQIFAISNPLEDPSDVNMDQLRFTHEFLVEGYYAPTHQLRDAVVDPRTRESRIRFLGTDARDEQTHYFCVDITIPPIDSDATEVPPMHVDAQELFVLQGHRRTTFLSASDDGHGRGMLTLSLSEAQALSDYPIVLHKFSVDASGERCTAVVGESSSLTREDVFQYADSSVFDGVRGRFCHDLEASYHRYDLVVLGLH